MDGDEPIVFSSEAERLRVACSRGVLRGYIPSVVTMVSLLVGVVTDDNCCCCCLDLFISSLLAWREGERGGGIWEKGRRGKRKD